jgi:hypothetical protein
MKRPCSVSFGFGGKLVALANNKVGWGGCYCQAAQVLLVGQDRHDLQDDQEGLHSTWVVEAATSHHKAGCWPWHSTHALGSQQCLVRPGAPC